MKDRIKQVQDEQHLTQQSFASLLGISPATLCNIYNGKSQPTLTLVNAIKKKFPTINLEWLLDGQPPMYKLSAPPAEEADGELAAQGTTDGTPYEPTLDFQDDTPTPAPGLFDQPQGHGVKRTPKNIAQTEVRYIDKPQRKITEIRIFYDDQTWETFVPKG